MRKRSVCLLFHACEWIAACYLHRGMSTAFTLQRAQHRRAFRSTARSVNTAAISRSLMT
jgi:hypothetical protein